MDQDIIKNLMTFSAVENFLSESDLMLVEEKLNYKLSQDYKFFLLDTNGGVPERTFFHNE
jgi:hypothetical protein